ncbi:O-antigen ligase family protein [Mordavella massiliensis]|uniref:O-antigen ligase family protein n=1 Tax=Mordavella massiliensis TaxID=1871024 RepID=UPI00210E947C|nr:O-antigen ligase family protein [Mordavella massiliensis]
MTISRAVVRIRLVIKIGSDPEKVGAVLFPIFNVISFISAFIFDIRAGMLSSLIILIYVLTHKRCMVWIYDKAFVAFYLINILSLYAYLFNGRPFVIFLNCITYNLLPMLMYGIGKSSISNEQNNPVFKALIYSNIIIVLVGFIIYFVPSLAVRVGMDSMVTAGISATGKGYRFGSYLGSLELGSICAISIPLLLMYNFKNKIVKYVTLFMFSVALLMTMQRGAWIVGIVGIFSCAIISAVLNKKGLKIIIGYSLLGIIIAAILFYFVNHYMSEGFFEHLQIRLRGLNANSMSTGRTEQAEEAMALFLEYPLGFGLGAAGNKASSYQMGVIPDGNLIRILVETGIFGMVAFLVLNIKAIVRGLRHKYYYMVVIILLFLAHSIGSNVLDFYYGSFIYWYILGFLNRTKEKYRLAECSSIFDH